MANLAGQFAGMITITVDENRASELTQDLRRLSAEDMTIIVGEGTHVVDNDAPLVSLEITGHDRPGIVHEVSSLCSGLGGNLLHLKTNLVSGSMSGEALFIASAQLQVGANTCLDTVKTALESLSDDLMVDIVMTDE
jgi:glycine cleavage system regulatory protein